jgi:hypothetical protein
MRRGLCVRHPGTSGCGPQDKADERRIAAWLAGNSPRFARGALRLGVLRGDLDVPGIAMSRPYAGSRL